MGALRRLFAKLRLRVNEAKSAVARPQDRKFLGYSFWYAKGSEVKRRVARKALVAMKDRVRDITKRSGGRSISSVVNELRGYLVGWKNYFQLADTPRIFSDLDEWIRHRLRAIQLKQWKRGNDDLSRARQARDASRRGSLGRQERPTLVEELGHGDQRRVTQRPLRQSRPTETRCDLNSLNRRMRIRTSGGVGGNRRGESRRSLPDWSAARPEP